MAENSTFGCIDHSTPTVDKATSGPWPAKRESSNCSGGLKNVENAIRELVAAIGVLRIPVASIAVVPPAVEPTPINLNLPESRPEVNVYPTFSPPSIVFEPEIQVNAQIPDLSEFIRFVKRAIVAAMILATVGGALIGARIAL